MLASLLIFLRNVVQRFSYPKAVYMGDGLILTKVFHLKMVLPSKDLSMTPGLVFEGCWEPMVTRVFLEMLSPGMTVLDIGAAFGYYTLLAADKVGDAGKVVSIEPEPFNFGIIEKNCFLNGLANRVILVNKAASDRIGTTRLYYKKDYVLGAPSLIGSHGEGFIDVATVTVDCLLRENNISGIDVAKIDAEGYEPFIIKGMRETIEQSRNLKIILEFSPGYYRGIGIDPRGFLNDLVGYGFRRIKKINEFTGRLEEIRKEDLDSNKLFMCYMEKE